MGSFQQCIHWLPRRAGVSRANLTAFTQNQLALSEKSELDPLVSDLVLQQAELIDQRKIISLLDAWKSEKGFLPESLSKIVHEVNSFGPWEVKEINWQQKQLTLQMDKGNIDIAALVKTLEALPSISSLGIKPHGNSGHFLLEASFDE